MKPFTFALTLAFTCYMFITQSQTKTQLVPTQEEIDTFGKTVSKIANPPALVDFDAYEQLVAQVKEHRKTRLVGLDKFLEMSSEFNTIILDTRSDEMYQRKHVKGAIHLNFADFTQENLAKLITNTETTILIYCNNNFEKDQVNFATKGISPSSIKTYKLDIKAGPKNNDKTIREEAQNTNEEKTIDKPLTLALNIPTYINLFGYGYKNVFELSELISVYNPDITFEGTSVE